MLALPISSACSQAIWQTKVATDMQGRVFSIRSMIAFSIIPVAYAVAGPLAESVFEPAMAEGGRLANVLGPLIGFGPGRGIGLMYVISGTLYVFVTTILLIQPRIRRLEIELEDAIDVGTEI
jgi:DHA3 family macrolide efflux protein-like MFS transporter